MFLRVQEKDLVVGTKYKISDREYDKYYGVFKGFPLWFDNYTIHVEFEKVYDITTQRINNMEFRLDYFSYYAFISDQPQWKMERRAVNLIVRRLIGDDNFEW